MSTLTHGSAAPLAGVRVIEVAAALSGPVAAMALADLGADVIKVEGPAGDMTRNLAPVANGLSAGFINANRGKRSVVIDLVRPEGKDLLEQLLANADVLVENWRDDAGGNLNLDLRKLRQRHPTLIVGSVRGLPGGTGRSRRTYDSHIQAAVGLAIAQGTHDGPQFVELNIADRVTAMRLTQELLAALYLRSTTGVASRVLVTMAGSMLGFAWGDLFADLTVVSESNQQQQQPNRRRLGMFAQSSDGRWLCYTAVRNDEWKALCALVGREDLSTEFATRDDRRRNAAEISAGLATWFRSRSREAALQLLDESGIPAAPVDRPEDVLYNPLLSGLVSERTYPGVGRVREVAPSPNLSAESLARPAPALGQHTDEILAEVGLDRERIRDLRASGVVA